MGGDVIPVVLFCSEAHFTALQAHKHDDKPKNITLLWYQPEVVWQNVNKNRIE